MHAGISCTEKGVVHESYASSQGGGLKSETVNVSLGVQKGYLTNLIT